jgi:23S rRNA pseudouridine1911/1915/1917 synthase
LPFVLAKYTYKPNQTQFNHKIQVVLLQNNINLSLKVSQKLLSRNRVFQSNINLDNKFLNFTLLHKLFLKVLKNGDYITKKYIYLAVFKPKSRGLKPIFVCNDFVVFDKPNKILTYPINKTNSYSMLDELRAFCGDEANFAHRLDYETSGLLLGATNKKSEIALKAIFANRKITKKYLALVDGYVKDDFIINKNIASSSEGACIKIKMRVDKNNIYSNSKTAISHIKVLKHFKPNQTFNTRTTLVEVDIKTGRQHQIRAHLSNEGFAILGDTLYMADDKIVNNHLIKHFNNKQRIKHFKHSKMMLHCYYLSFVYNNINFSLSSKRIFISF